MPAAQPLSLDALRRLISENDYWNPHSAQHKELQRKVSEGFGRLYPVKGDFTEGSSLERDQPNEVDLEELKKRHREISDERKRLLFDNAPQPAIYDKDGNMLQDHKLPDPQILERIEELRGEEDRLWDLLKRLGFRPDIQLDMGK
jgi:hypothetical protein